MSIAFHAAVWRLIALVLCVCAIEFVFAATGNAFLVHAANGSLSSFSGGVTADNATFTTIHQGYGSDKQAFLAQYPGTAGSGTAHGALAVSWAPGQTVTYGAAFRLSHGFHRRPQGQQPRWEGERSRGRRARQQGAW